MTARILVSLSLLVLASPAFAKRPVDVADRIAREIEASSNTLTTTGIDGVKMKKSEEGLHTYYKATIHGMDVVKKWGGPLTITSNGGKTVRVYGGGGFSMIRSARTTTHKPGKDGAIRFDANIWNQFGTVVKGSSSIRTVDKYGYTDPANVARGKDGRFVSSKGKAR